MTEPSISRTNAQLVSCVVPVRDENQAAVTVVNRLLNLEPSRELGLRIGEVIVIDDGSSTLFSIQDANHLDNRITIIRHPVARGYGAAIKAGIHRSRYDWIAWIDGDGTYAPEDLRVLFDTLGRCDQAIGVRTRDFGSARRLRRATKLLIRFVVSGLWRTRIPDVNSGLRAFARHALVRYMGEFPDGFSCSTTATLAALNRGDRILFRPAQYFRRESGSTSKFRPVRDTWKLVVVIAHQYLRRKCRR